MAKVVSCLYLTFKFTKRLVVTCLDNQLKSHWSSFDLFLKRSQWSFNYECAGFSSNQKTCRFLRQFFGEQQEFIRKLPLSCSFSDVRFVCLQFSALSHMVGDNDFQKIVQRHEILKFLRLPPHRRVAVCIFDRSIRGILQAFHVDIKVVLYRMTKLLEFVFTMAWHLCPT